MGVYLPILPNEYQEVEYIQSSGTQFIDTGYLITPTTEVSVDYQFTNASNQDFAFGVGSDTDTSLYMNFCIYIGKTDSVLYFKAGLGDGTNSTTTFKNTGPSVDTNRHIFILNNGHLKTYNSSGTLQSDVTTKSTITRTATHSFGIFCWWRYDTNAWSNITAGRLYGCQVKENGTLVRNFIPCYRKSDNIIGLYDLVNNQFYTNAGTGTFNKGADVTAVPLKNAYIGKVYEYDFTKSDGGRTLDSGVTRDSNGLYLTSSSQYVDSYSSAPSIIYSGTPSKITVTYYKSQSSTGTGMGDGISIGVLLPRNQNNLNYLATNLNGTISNINLGANPTGNVVWEMDIDSSTTNWTVTHKITGVSAVTESSGALKTLFTNQSLKIRIIDWENTTSIRIKSIVIEY